MVTLLVIAIAAWAGHRLGRVDREEERDRAADFTRHTDDALGIVSPFLDERSARLRLVPARGEWTLKDDLELRRAIKKAAR